MHNTGNTPFLLELMEVAGEPSCFLITSVDSCTCAVSIGQDVRIRNLKKKKSMKGGLNRRGQSSRTPRPQWPMGTTFFRRASRLDRGLSWFR